MIPFEKKNDKGRCFHWKNQRIARQETSAFLEDKTYIAVRFDTVYNSCAMLGYDYRTFQKKR